MSKPHSEWRSGSSIRRRIATPRSATLAMRLCTGRSPDDDEVKRIIAFSNAQLQKFSEKKADPAAVAGVSGRPDLPELAAWTLVCRSVLNLDVTLTKD